MFEKNIFELFFKKKSLRLMEQKYSKKGIDKIHTIVTTKLLVALLKVYTMLFKGLKIIAKINK